MRSDRSKGPWLCLDFSAGAGDTNLTTSGGFDGAVEWCRALRDCTVGHIRRAEFRSAAHVRLAPWEMTSGDRQRFLFNRAWRAAISLPCFRAFETVAEHTFLFFRIGELHHVQQHPALVPQVKRRSSTVHWTLVGVQRYQDGTSSSVSAGAARPAASSHGSSSVIKSLLCEKPGL